MYIYIYIYIYVCVCVSVCVMKRCKNTQELSMEHCKLKLINNHLFSLISVFV